jgi:hypothetical protein
MSGRAGLTLAVGESYLYKTAASGDFRSFVIFRTAYNPMKGM